MDSDVMVDLTDPDLFVRGDHHAALESLRARTPVYWNPLPDGSGFWALTRYDDVVNAYRQHAQFSSAGGAMLGGSLRSERDSASGRMLVATDLPRHRLLRQLIHPAFSAHVVERVRRQIAELLDEAFQRMLGDGGCDFAVDIAELMPVGAVMAMFDVGYEDARALVRLTRSMIGYRDPVQGRPGSDERIHLAGIQAAIFDFFTDLAGERRSSSGDDVISVLRGGRMNGRPLSEADILYNCMNVAVGGNETSSYTACAGVEALATHPDQYDRLIGSPQLLSSMVEETLRWSSTNAYVQRVAVSDVEIRGQLIRAGDSVTLWNVSANRDEEQFPHAGRFDITRSPNRHLSFGSGLHRCVGAPIGLAELDDVFDRLISNGVRLAISGPVSRLRSNFILGYTSLPVSVGA